MPYKEKRAIERARFDTWACYRYICNKLYARLWYLSGVTVWRNSRQTQFLIRTVYFVTFILLHLFRNTIFSAIVQNPIPRFDVAISPRKFICSVIQVNIIIAFKATTLLKVERGNCYLFRVIDPIYLCQWLHIQSWTSIVILAVNFFILRILYSFFVS